MDAYLDALEKEMTQCKEWLAGKQMVRVYVGGGTPTSLSEEQFERLMAMIEKYLSMEQSKEFTVEAGRPDSITEGKLRSMKAHGVTRISINPQSMKEHTLELLGRKHTVEEIREKFMLARTLGFDNINMDLIAGLPEETLEDFKETLREVEALKPDSITVHTLVIKRASRLRKEQLEQGGEMPASNRCKKRQSSFAGYTDMSRIICIARKIRHIRREIPIRKMWLMQNREKNVCITYLLWRNCSRSWHLAAEVRPRSYFRRKTGWNE